MKKLLSTMLVVLLLGAGAAEAAKTKRRSSNGTAAKRASSGKSSKPSAKRSASKRRGTSRRASRPSRPTPERYKEFQQVLADKGFYDGPIDGVWGSECVAALKRFQESEGLAVDGKLGARSIIALGLGPQRSAESQFLVKPPTDTSDEP